MGSSHCYDIVAIIIKWKYFLSNKVYKKDNDCWEVKVSNGHYPFLFLYLIKNELSKSVLFDSSKPLIILSYKKSSV